MLMVTDDFIKPDVFHEIISRDIRRIYTVQRRTVEKHLGIRSGELLKSLIRVPVDVPELGKVYHMRYLPYLRFQDIRTRYKKGQGLRKATGLALYNRVIWGVFYNETLPDIQDALNREFRNSINQEIKEEKR